MATVAMSNDNTRVAVATIATDTGTWGNDGGGGGIADEPDIVYQTTTAQSRKVSTTLIGRDYTHGSGTDMDGTPANTAHCIMKLNVTNNAALNTRTTPGSELKVGSGSGDYHSYYLYGSDNYPPRGGWQIIAIAPSVTGYASVVGDTGTPNDSSILYWSWLGDFTATSKSENLAIDAIDVGLGLCLVNGDGASADGIFQDFIDYDEGTSGNRWGFVYTEGGVLFCTGQICIGQTSAGTSTITEFTDSVKTLVWNNGLVTTGFHRFLIDLATSGTAVTLTNCSFGSLGKEDNDGDRSYTTTEDSRPIFEVTGAHASADLVATACVFDNFASFILNLQCDFVDCTITNSGDVICGTGAQLNGLTLSGCTCPADTAAISWDVNLDPDGDLDNITITKGSLAHHAIEFGTTAPLTMTIRGWTTASFNASDAQNDSTFLFADRGSDVTWTVNVIGGSGNFSYKAARGTDTVNIVISPVTTLINVKDETDANLSGVSVLVEAGDDTGDLAYDDTVTITRVTTTASVAHTAHGMANGDKVVIRKVIEPEYRGVHVISNVTTNAYDYTVSGSPDTPATGTIKATAAVLHGTTDGSGNISASASYSVDQNIRVVARLATTTPLYKPQSVTDVIDKDNGLTKSIKMVRDD